MSATNLIIFLSFKNDYEISVLMMVYRSMWCTNDIDTINSTWWQLFWCYKRTLLMHTIIETAPCLCWPLLLWETLKKSGTICVFKIGPYSLDFYHKIDYHKLKAKIHFFLYDFIRCFIIFSNHVALWLLVENMKSFEHVRHLSNSVTSSYSTIERWGTIVN